MCISEEFLLTPIQLHSFRQTCFFYRFVPLKTLTHSVLPCFQVISARIVKLSCSTTVIQINGQALNTEYSLKWISLALTFQAAEILKILLE